MGLSNPTTEDFIDWLVDRSRSIQDQGDQGITEHLMPKEIEKKTTRHDLLIASVYQADVGAQDEIIVLGIFGSFIILPSGL